MAKRRISLKTGAPARKLRFDSSMSSEQIVEWLEQAKLHAHFSVLSWDDRHIHASECHAVLELFQFISRRGRCLDRLNIEFCTGPVDLIVTTALVLESLKHLTLANARDQEGTIFRLASTLRLNASLKSLWLLVPMGVRSAIAIGQALALNDSLEKLSLSGSSHWNGTKVKGSNGQTDTSLDKDDEVQTDDENDDEGSTDDEANEEETIFYDPDEADVAEGDSSDDDEDYYDDEDDYTTDDDEGLGQDGPSTTGMTAQQQQQNALRIPQAIAEGLRQNRGLRSIDFSSCALKDESAAILVESLVGHWALETLDLSRNYCRERTMYALQAILEHPNSQLTTLDLRQQCGGKKHQRANKLHPKSSPLDISPLCAALEHNEIIKTLRLSHNRLDDTAVSRLVQSLQGNETLQELDLQYNQITAKGLEVLTNGLNKLPSLQVLLLGGNAFGDKGTELLVQLEDDDDSVCTILEHDPRKRNNKQRSGGKHHGGGSVNSGEDTFHSATSKNSKSSSKFKTGMKHLMGGLTGISEK